MAKTSAVQLQYSVETGKRIEMTRKSLGVSARHLARAVGVSPSMISWYESGRTVCPPVRLAQIAAALGVSIGALMPRVLSRPVLHKV